MAPAESLCEVCKEINFDALRGPSVIDVQDIIAARFEGERFATVKPGTSHEKVTLGPLRRIKKDAQRCSLCSLFFRIIEMQGAIYQHNSAYATLDSNDIMFRADPDLSYYARIIGVNDSRGGHFVLRRLNLTCHSKNSPDNPVAYFDHLLQVCNVGTLSNFSNGLAIQPHRTEISMPFGGRKRSPKLDLELVRSWMQICINEHGRHCLLDSSHVESTHMDTFRLIDVNQMSILEVHHLKLATLDFMALSYVWGSTQSVQLLKANSVSLQKTGSLNKLALPLTISDTIYLVRLLGSRYLWVDALCIIQDDQNDQSYQIEKMATIYSSASLTVLSASGEDSNGGLPGMGSSTRLSEQQEVVVIAPSENNQGLSVMNCLKSHPKHWDEWFTRGQEDVDASKWSHRAWTMQEKALSRRTLMFTKEQVFWNCQQAYFCEESHFEVPSTRVKHYYPSAHKVGIRQLKDGVSYPWELYGDLVENYMRRDLTYKGDIFAAFHPILDTMEKATKVEFLWGLPRSRSELGLFWQTFHGLRRRTTLSTLPMTSLKKRVAFPSWSWFGWLGDIVCRVGDRRRESESAVIACFTHQSNPLRLKHVASKFGGSNTSDLWTDIEIQRQAVSLTDLVQNLQDTCVKALGQYPNEHLLFFWTDSSFFRVTQEQNRESAPSSYTDRTNELRPRIQDQDGKDVGFVCKCYSTRKSSENDMHEFLAVGQRRILGIPESLAEEICPPAILALQIQRDEHGICSRANAAEIDLKAWTRAEPRKVLVVLQ